MQRKMFQHFAIGLALLSSAGCHLPGDNRENSKSAAAPASVDETRMLQADQEPGNWMSYGRTYSEQRFSPLRQINEQNVGQLGLAWYVDLDARRGQEATPIVVDGVMYFSTAWSKVFAVNAARGEKLWSYDPKVPPEWAVKACCDVVNRGVAVWRGKVFVGTLDGRLVALDASTGKPAWETLTIDPQYRYTITGAPRVVKGKVLIGNGGAEMGVRGYVSAYDADTGKLAWRFYTVPGDPSKPFESPALEKAAKTWSGEWWKLGGGGTVWDSIVYDPELDLLYIGTGNGTPWNRRARSPQGRDNLFTSSIVALRPETGEYLWHYQEVPGDAWDYDSAAPIILADITVGGAPRKVLFQAPKDGYFYVLDRATGEVISAKPYTTVTWATGIDPTTGRPLENASARYEEGGKAAPLVPGPLGGHSWHSMSYSPQTGLVYIPVQEAGFLYKSEVHFQERNLAFNTAIDFVAGGMPQRPEVKKSILDSIKGHLSAWDPIQQKEIWRVDRSSPVNGGILSTAGISEVRQYAAAHGHISVTSRAIILEKCFTLLHGCGAGRGPRRLQLRLRKLRQRRQAGLACQFEGENAADVLQATGFECGFATSERKYAAPANHHGHVLVAADGVAYGSGDYTALRVGRPQLFALVGSIRFEIALRVAFEYKISGR